VPNAASPAKTSFLARPRIPRPVVENFVTRFFQPTLLPYPTQKKHPTDIEANRSVASELLGREISDAEILPSLILPEPVPRSDRWLLCPFSSSLNKDYPAEKWATALQILAPERGDSPLHLAAGPNQQEQLAAFTQILRAAGIQNLVIDPQKALSDFLKSIAAARLVLTVDTAAAHMACALGSPAIIASAGHHPETTPPTRRTAFSIGSCRHRNSAKVNGANTPLRKSSPTLSAKSSPLSQEQYPATIHSVYENNFSTVSRLHSRDSASTECF
jgi:ADP-heptose:LPS heptosyltransferase